MNLARFQKPSRYIGNEVNIIRKGANINPFRKLGKDFLSNGVKVALCFPDTYEIGMSHIGLKILYSIINNIPYASAERVFAPWVDFESFLRQNDLPLTSLENKQPLKDFDVVGFTLQYELSYTNVLNMLDLGGIPIRADDRGAEYPLIIAGGPCTVNPLPLIPFIDIFVIGDGEEVIEEIIEVHKNFKMQSAKCKVQSEGFKIKENLLKALSKLEGVYVPSLHSSNNSKIKKRIVEDLNKTLFPESPIVPFASIVHDRVAIEISRGCTKGCRFCQAGMIYRPLRERSLEKILSLAQKSIFNTGHEEISFTSLSAGDYTNLLTLIKTFNKLCSGSNTAISLPSLRVGAISSDILKEIKSVRKTGFTIAPEAGTKKLRNVINKDFTEEEYTKTLKKLFTEGWKNIKLYFMIGLPDETPTDIDGIISMAETASKKGREITGSRVNINVGISAFVPKPHSPFQWLGQLPYGELREKQNFLKKTLKKRGLNFKGQHVELSLLEAVFSRGDRNSAKLLETAWRLGCRFDGWSEVFSFDNWLVASEKTGIDLYEYASRRFDLNAELPWEFIDTGISKNFLKSEYQKALQGEVTPDCKDICYGCGLECNSRKQGTENGTQDSGFRIQDSGYKIQDEKYAKHTVHNMESLSSEFRKWTMSPRDFPFWVLGSEKNPLVDTHHQKTGDSIKIRVKFSKTGTLRYLSHQELMTAILRALRRAKIPVLYSKGFHPHPKLSFGPALPSGVEGLNEYFDIKTSSQINPSDFLTRLNTELPQGLEVHDTVTISKTEKSLNDFISRYEYELTIDRSSYKSINAFLNLPHCIISRDKRSIDIRPVLEKAEICGSTLHLILQDSDIIKARLYEILKEMLQKSIEEIQRLPIKRVRLYGYNNREWIEPLKRKVSWREK